MVSDGLTQTLAIVSLKVYKQMVGVFLTSGGARTGYHPAVLNPGGIRQLTAPESGQPEVSPLYDPRVLFLKEAPKVMFTGLTEKIGAPKDYSEGREDQR